MTVIFAVGFAGGLRATVVTDSLQGPLIVVMSLLMLPFGLPRSAGFPGCQRRAGDFSLHAPVQEFTPPWIAASSATRSLSHPARASSRFASGKTELEALGYTYGPRSSAGAISGSSRAYRRRVVAQAISRPPKRRG